MRTKFNGQLAMKARLQAMKVPFKEEYRWHPTRKFRCDFFIEPNVLCEFDGATYVKGGHSSAAGIDRDCDKTNEASLHGFKLLRFTQKLMREPGYFERVVCNAIFEVVEVDFATGVKTYLLPGGAKYRIV